MFNPLRLFRRAEHIDETADAYVEGRATERDMAELQARAESDPGLLDDLDSIRSTVALLCSVEPGKAPRSFALAEAPVQVRVRRSRMAMAPAVFAIAAAAAVGLLAVGNLTDIVRQSDSTSEDSNRTALQASDESLPQGAITGGEFESALVPPSLESGDAASGGGSVARAQATATQSAAGAGDFAQDGISTSPATDSPAIQIPESALPPAPGDTGSIPSAGEDSGSSAAESTVTNSIAVQPGLPEPDLEGKEFGEPGEAVAGGSQATGEQAGAANLATPLPLPTTTGLFDPGITAPIASTDPDPFVAEQGNDQSGVPLPIWQLQIGFTIFAVLMAGAWMLLQRRLTA